jgi:flagellum-specific ATP synthase
MLPRLLERAGNGEEGQGSITAVCTVLVEGDDMDDPVADTVRGIVDGHIVLSRRLATHGHYPAIDLLESVSRTMNLTVAPEQVEAANVVRDLVATWRENEELIRLGAYRKGSDPKVDLAIAAEPRIAAFLTQKVDENTDFATLVQVLVGLAADPAGRKTVKKA